MAPVNDLIANATVLTLEPIPTAALPATPVTGTTVAATFTEDSSIPGGNVGNGPSVWYTFNIPTRTVVNITIVALGGGFPAARPLFNLFSGPASATTAQLTATGWFIAPQASITPDVRTFIRFIAEANQDYYLHINNNSSSTVTGTFGFYFTKAPLAKPPSGTHWKPNRVRNLGRWSEAYVNVPANTATITKTIPSITGATPNEPPPLPGRLVRPWILGMLTEPKLVETTYVLAFVSYLDDGSNAIQSIAISSGSVAWTPIVQFTASPSTGGVMHEVWIGQIGDEIEYAPTWTVTLNNATTIKGAFFWAFTGLDPTDPVAGYTTHKASGGGTNFDHDFDMDAVADGRDGLLIVMHVPNGNVTGVSNPPQLNTELPGWNGGIGVAPGVARLMFSGTLPVDPGPPIIDRGAHYYYAADYRQAPHPANATAGVRNIGYHLTASAHQGVVGILLKGAPQT